MRLVILGALMSSVPVWAAAQSAFELDEITVGLGFFPLELSQTGSTVEVIGEGEAAATGASQTDALAALPGVSVAANGPLGSSSSVRIRGLQDKYIQVRMDGIDVTDPSNTQNQFAFGPLTSGFADRTEVLKGAQSARYGASAIGGVIDMTSWRPVAEGWSGRAGAEAGSYGTVLGSASYGYLASDGAELAFTVTGAESDGFSSRTSDTEDDGFSQRGLSFYGAMPVGEAVTLGLNGFWSDSSSEYDLGTYTDAGQVDETRTGLRAFAEIETGAVSHELAISRSRNERYYPGGFTENFTGERTKAEYTGRTELGAGLALGWGAEAAEERAVLDGTAFEASSVAAFGEVLWSPSERTDVSLALRFDDAEDFGGELTGRLAVAHRLRDDLILRGVAATGFRAPSLYERYEPTYGNADLEAETSRSLELGIEKRYGAESFARATLFRSEIDNLIGFTSTYDQVAGTTTTYGIELSGAAALSETLRLTAAYTLTKGDSAGSDLIRTPEHEIEMGLEKDFGSKLTGALSLRHVAGSIDYDSSFSLVDVEAATVLNLGVSYAVSEAVEAYVRIENVTDADYEIIPGFNTPGRSLYAGIRATF